jgi:UDP-glucose 4-epimerase
LEKIPFYKISIVNKKDLEEPFKKHKIYAVIHFAGKKAAGESIESLYFIMKITSQELLISLNYV